jgi:two-component system, cell cycle sensor histidine kinase and response regulator CckA
MSWSVPVGWNEPPSHARVGTTPLTLPAALAWFVAYLLVGGGVLLLQREVGASFWYPPVTLAILIVALYGWRAGPIVLLADSMISSFQFGSLLAGTVVGTSTLLEASLAAAFLAEANVDLRLPDVRSLMRLFVLGAIVPTLGGVTHGSLWLLALGVYEPASAFYTWLTWWLGDAVTTACLLPMLLIIAVPRLFPAQRLQRPGELHPNPRQTLALVLVAITICAFAFGWGAGQREHLSHSLKYLCFLPVIWAAITLGVSGTSALVAVISTLAVILSLFNGSPVGLANIVDAHAVLDIQLFMLVLSFGGMTLAMALEGERAARAASQRDAEALSASADRLRQILQEMPVMLDAFDADGSIIVWNREAERATGYSAAEIVGNPRAMELLYPEEGYRQAMLAEWTRRGNNYRGWIWEIAHKDGSSRTIAWSNISGQVPIEGWASWGIGIDLTEQRRAEQARRLLGAAQEQAGEGTMITDAAGTILSVNPAFEHISGYSAEELIGKSPAMLKSGQHDSAFYRQLWQTIGGGEVWRGRFANRAKDGHDYTVEATIAPIRGSDGAIEHYVAVERDVTRELLMEAQFRQAQKMEAIGRLAGGIAHDFNNLLSVINGYSDLLLDALPDPNDPLRQDLEPIREAGRRAANLTRQLLIFSRHQQLQPEIVYLDRVLAEIEQLLRRLIGEDIEVVTYSTPGLWPVSADRGQLEQVIMNLVVNARDAMPSGGTLRLATRNVLVDADHGEPGEYVRLEVSDTGTGMSAEVLAHVFEPFYTTKETGKGTGLGLAIVHGIVTKSGGTVAVSSIPGRGTRFTVDLPRAAHGGAADTPSREPLMSGTETILLVEDEPPIRTLASRVLRAQGYTVLVAANGVEALEHCAGSTPIQLLLSDIVMPEMSGQELAAAALRRRPDLAVLFMSGYPDRSPGSGQEWKPEIPLLAKPFTTAGLCKAVRAALDKRGLGSAEPHGPERRDEAR